MLGKDRILGASLVATLATLVRLHLIYTVESNRGRYPTTSGLEDTQQHTRTHKQMHAHHIENVFETYDFSMLNFI